MTRSPSYIWLIKKVVANMMVQRVFPALNLAREIDGAASAIVSCPELILLRVKQGLLARTFTDAGSSSGRSGSSQASPNVKIRIDRLKAAAAAGGDPSVRGYTIFEQMSAELAAVPAHRLRRPERAFRLEYAGERMVDEGGGYHEAISAACAELRAALPQSDAEQAASAAAAAAAAAAARNAPSASGAEGRTRVPDAPTLSLSDALPIMIRTPNARRREAGSDGAGRGVTSAVALEEMLPMPPLVELRKPARRQQLRFLGQLLGIAVRSSSPIDVQLPRLVWQMIVLEARRVHGVLMLSDPVPPHDALRAWRAAQRLLLQRQQQQQQQQQHHGDPRASDYSSDDDGSAAAGERDDALSGAAADTLHVRSAASAASEPLELLAENQALPAPALAAAAGLDDLLSRTAAAIEGELGSVDAELRATLDRLAAATSEAGVAQLGLRFTSRGWRGDNITLVPRGAQCAVTLENRALYRDLVVRQRAEELHGALAPLCFGFAEIVRRASCASAPRAPLALRPIPPCSAHTASAALSLPHVSLPAA